MTNKNFFKILFDENEFSCFSLDNKGTKVSKAGPYYLNTCNYFSINPLDGEKDNNPTEAYHSADKPRRADCNVTVYRTFLIEMDNTSAEDQLKYVRSINMPFSTMVWSGGKSIHFLLVLEDPCRDEKEYRALAERIQKAVGLDKVDRANKNPSRFSRYPNAVRADTGKKQTLGYVGSRIKQADLEAWLLSRGITKEEPKPVSKPRFNPYTVETNVYTGEPMTFKRRLNGFTLNFLMDGAPEGQRNQKLFLAACDFAKCGYEQEAAEERLIEASGLPYQEATRTIRSAYNRVESEN